MKLVLSSRGRRQHGDDGLFRPTELIGKAGRQLAEKVRSHSDLVTLRHSVSPPAASGTRGHRCSIFFS